MSVPDHAYHSAGRVDHHDGLPKDVVAQLEDPPADRAARPKTRWMSNRSGSEKCVPSASSAGTLLACNQCTRIPSPTPGLRLSDCANSASGPERPSSHNRTCHHRLKTVQPQEHTGRQFGEVVGIDLQIPELSQPTEQIGRQRGQEIVADVRLPKLRQAFEHVWTQLAQFAEEAKIQHLQPFQIIEDSRGKLAHAAPIVQREIQPPKVRQTVEDPRRQPPGGSDSSGLVDNLSEDNSSSREHVRPQPVQAVVVQL